MTLYGPDLSNNNWSGKAPVDIVPWLGQLKTQGFSFIEHKVSEGDYYTDPYWPTVYQWAQDNDFVAVGYHYVIGGIDPARQAARYLKNDPSKGAAPAMLDFEANSGGIENFHAVWQAFQAAGINVRLAYIPHWYWQDIGSPSLTGVTGLVSSAYYERGNYASAEYLDSGGDNGEGWTGYGGATPAIWQFTDSALIAGLNVDCNAYRGSLDDLKILLGVTPGSPSTGVSPVTPIPNPSTLAVLRTIRCSCVALSWRAGRSSVAARWSMRSLPSVRRCSSPVSMRRR